MSTGKIPDERDGSTSVSNLRASECWSKVIKPLEHYNLWLHPGLKNIHDIKGLVRFFANSLSFYADFQ
jgi:hypothetical protein